MNRMKDSNSPTADPSQAPPPASPPSSARPASGKHVKLGWCLLLLAVLLWAPLPVIPFLSLPASVKVSLAAGLFAAVQIAWWGGTALAGPAAVKQCYGWFKRKLGAGVSP